MRTLKRMAARLQQFWLWRRYSFARSEFQSTHYMQHNQRRLEHLASLKLPLAGCTVLEVGAGIGDHTSFFLDRGCTMIVTDGRPMNVRILRLRYPMLDVRHLNLDGPDSGFGDMVDVVYCYGTLYHLERPGEALAFMAAHCHRLLLLETMVSPGVDEALNPVDEQRANPTQAVSGHGCRPTRAWILARLREHLPYAYMTRTQPWHEEFPLEWDFVPRGPRFPSRAVFVASREPLEIDALSEEIVEHQVRH